MSNSSYGATGTGATPLARRKSEPSSFFLGTDEDDGLLQSERPLLRSLSGIMDVKALGGDDDDVFDTSRRSNEASNLLPPLETGQRTLGTFQGVFCPVSLSMLSSILFLRMGYIVGNVGLVGTAVQLFIAYSILVATVLSMSAIATNGAVVEAGGVYFIVSRTLGIEFGGAVGVLLYFAHAVASALYLAACAEGIVDNFGPLGSLMQSMPGGEWYVFLYASAVNLLNLCIGLVGAKFYGKASVVVLSTVAVCAIATVSSFVTANTFSGTYVFNDTTSCFSPADSNVTNCTRSVEGTFTGLAASTQKSLRDTFYSNLYPKYEFDCSNAAAKVDFFKVFAVLFSGMTGIMTGANLSGELQHPGRAIPVGTLSACGFTASVYITMAVLTALTCSPLLLQHHCLYLSDFSLWKPIVTVGVLAAAFSASLNKMMGASRILQAVAKDSVFGPMLAPLVAGTTASGNPVASVVLTVFMVELFLLMGSLNAIAQLNSILFLLAYALINVSCLGLELASAPNFRPSFKYFSWFTCLVGLVGTVAMMFLVSPAFASLGVLLCLCICMAVHFFAPMENYNFGSISQALIFHQVRKYLLLLDPRKSHVKFWRPQVLLLLSDPARNVALIHFVNALKKGGLYVLGHVYAGNLAHVDEDPCAGRLLRWLEMVDKLKIKAFVELTMASSLREGVHQLARISGVGAMKPNTVVLGWPGDSGGEADSDVQSLFPLEEPESGEGRLLWNKDDFVGVLADIIKMGRNICICRHFQNLRSGGVGANLFTNKFRKSESEMYLDAWLVDFFAAADSKSTDITDKTCLFLLQLAVIVNSVPRWKPLTLRVFCAEPSSSSYPAISLHRMLELLRIRAEAHVIPNSELAADAGTAVSNRSERTAVTFVYMPELPKTSSGKAECYLEQLDALTRHWPPTVVIRGVSPVTSVTL